MHVCLRVLVRVYVRTEDSTHTDGLMRKPCSEPDFYVLFIFLWHSSGNRDTELQALFRLVTEGNSGILTEARGFYRSDVQQNGTQFLWLAQRMQMVLPRHQF